MTAEQRTEAGLLHRLELVFSGEYVSTGWERSE